MGSRSRRINAWSLLAAVAVFALLPVAARADRIWTKANPKASPFERKDLKIQKFENGNLVFKVMTSDRLDSRPLTEIWQIEADGEPRLNAAEAAFAAGDFARATGEYESGLAGSRAPWVKLRAATRVVESAANSKNFPAAVKGYAELLKIDANLAASYRPAPAKDAPAASLAGATSAAESAAGATGNAEHKSLLLTLALEYARAGNDNASATRIAQALSGVDAPPPTAATAAGGTPGATAAAGAQANRRIQLAFVSLGNKDFAAALKQIGEAPEVFTEPGEQVDALYVMAEAKNGLAKTADELKDAAIDYMRVVARAKSGNLRTPQAAQRVADALLKTAGIHERIKATDEAQLLYQQVAAEYEGTEAAAKAAAALQRLDKKEP